MLLQSALTVRIIVVSILQIWPILYDSFFAYKLLKRTKNRSTVTLSCFFIFTALAFFLAPVSIILANTPFAYLCYLIAFFSFTFAHSFIVIFSWLMVNVDEKLSRKNYYTGILIYGIGSTYVFWIGIFFEGIRYDSGTGWIPVFSELFLFISCSYITIFLVVPEIFLVVKLINIFEGVSLKRRIKMFIFSVFLEFAILLVIVLYNTWINNPVYKVIYSFLMPPLSMLAAYFIYKSFGKVLE